MAIEMHFHTRTDAEPWRCECPTFGITSDSTKGSSLDLCRKLVALGVQDQPAVVFREGKPALRIGSISKAAGVTVSENDADGPRFAKWVPFTLSRDAFSTGNRPSPMCQTEGAATLVAADRFVDPEGALREPLRVAA